MRYFILTDPMDDSMVFVTNDDAMWNGSDLSRLAKDAGPFVKEISPAEFAIARIRGKVIYQPESLHNE